MPGESHKATAVHILTNTAQLLGGSNSAFHPVPDPLYNNDTSISALEIHTPFFPYPSQSVTPISSSSSSVTTDSLNLDFSQLGPHEQTGYEFDLRPPSPPPPVPFISGQNNVQGDHVIYYFEHVRKVQYMFAGNTFTNATYSVSFSAKQDSPLILLIGPDFS